MEKPEHRTAGDMDPDAFRRAGVRLVDWIARYLSEPTAYSVLSRVQPGEVAEHLADEAPSSGEPIERILDDFEKTVLPGITHWNHPGFFGYFSITGSAPGVLGEMLCAALNVNSMLWKTSPAATELEHRTLDWLRRMVGLPPAFWGILYDTASISTLHGIAAARERVERGDIRKRGMAGRIDLPVLRLYASENAHSSVDKAAITLGIGLDNLCKVRVDASQRMDVEDLRLQMAEDRAAGRMPFCVVATIGTTSTTAVDPVRSIASLCRAEACWLHVDAAYAGPAAALPEMRPHFDGWEEADSIVLNPHKWLFTPIDCSAFYTRHPDVLKQAFSLVPEYLKTSDSAENLMDFGIQLGRRFRALKLWFVLRTFGQQGIRDRLREHVRLARRFAEWVDKHPDFERLAEAPFSVVCFRARPAWAADEELDGLNARLLDAVNATGECFLSHTRVNGRFSLRLAVGNLRTEERHVRRAWEILEEKIRSMHPEE